MNRSCRVLPLFFVFSLLVPGGRDGAAQTVVQGRPAGPFDAYVVPDGGAQSHPLQGTFIVTTNQAQCPVGLRAQRGSNAGLVVTQHGLGDHGPGLKMEQRLHITLWNPGQSGIDGITLVVQGLTNTPRMSQAAQSGLGDAGTISRKVSLGLNVAARKQAVTDLTVDSFTAVTRIDLVDISYQDGSSWHASEKQACQITPDLYMPVDLAAR